MSIAALAAAACALAAPPAPSEFVMPVNNLPAGAHCGAFAQNYFHTGDSWPVDDELAAYVRGIAERYRPLFWFANRNMDWPMSGEYYLAHSALKYSATYQATDATTIISQGSLSSSTVLDTGLGGPQWAAGTDAVWPAGCTYGVPFDDLAKYPAAERAAINRWALDFDTNFSAGERDVAPVYVRYHNTRDPNGQHVVDITYVLIFGDQAGRLGLFGHKADIEHVTVRFAVASADGQLTPANMFFGHHGDGVWLPWSDVETTADGNPVAYIDPDFHSIYPTAGRHRLNSLPNLAEQFWDFTEQGIAWWGGMVGGHLRPLVFLPQINELHTVSLSDPSLAWVRYRGRFGLWEVNSLYMQPWIGAECPSWRKADPQKGNVYQCDPTNSSVAHLGSQLTIPPSGAPCPVEVSMKPSSFETECQCSRFDSNTRPWSNRPFAYCGGDYPGSQHWQGAQHYSCPHCAENGLQMNVTCPNNWAACDILLLVYHCPGCSSAVNGNWPSTLEAEDWQPSSCAPHFCSISSLLAANNETGDAVLGTAHPMVAFHKQVRGGHEERIPEGSTEPTMYYALLVQEAIYCADQGESSCSGLCQWSGGECQPGYCAGRRAGGTSGGATGGGATSGGVGQQPRCQQHCAPGAPTGDCNAFV
eukprot:TRINITY_DN1198_c0_g1_i1.p1 TRINITY_DN1198_c0_g1~~TRINITY_DN1198_c0_g1_i1.p1  ORF type:complete len:644 (+),score=182.40 TRINITY_DN1198_c0_g1_i1:108-2039(+)